MEPDNEFQLLIDRYGTIDLNDFVQTGDDNVIHKDFVKTNAFPVDVFPSPFLELIQECSKSLNFPTDYTGAAILSAVSTAIGKSCKLQVKSRWYEFPAFFIAIIGNAGTNKSHPLEMAFKPFEEMDKAVIQRYRQEVELYEAFQSLSKKDRAGLPAPAKPVLIKTLLHNFTGEILHQRLADNERGCVVVSEELATFLEGMNNYSKGDQTSLYLSLWSNKSTSIDRVSTTVPLWLSQPFLNIIGTLQPRVLPKLFPAGKTDNGFLQRFLFALPDSAEKQAINTLQIDANVFDDYSMWLDVFMHHTVITIGPETEQPQPKIYQWSDAAKDFFYRWQAEMTDKVNDNAETLWGELLSKFDIHFCRLSLVMQIMEDYWSSEISLRAVEGAAKLCAYFENCAMKVLEILGADKKDGITKKDVILYLSKEGETAQSEIAKLLNVSRQYVSRIIKQ